MSMICFIVSECMQHCHTLPNLTTKIYNTLLYQSYQTSPQTYTTLYPSYQTSPQTYTTLYQSYQTSPQTYTYNTTVYQSYQTSPQTYTTLYQSYQNAVLSRHQRVITTNAAKKHCNMAMKISRMQHCNIYLQLSTTKYL